MVFESSASALTCTHTTRTGAELRVWFTYNHIQSLYSSRKSLWREHACASARSEACLLPKQNPFVGSNIISEINKQMQPAFGRDSRLCSHCMIPKRCDQSTSFSFLGFLSRPRMAAHSSLAKNLSSYQHCVRVQEHIFEQYTYFGGAYVRVFLIIETHRYTHSQQIGVGQAYYIIRMVNDRQWWVNDYILRDYYGWWCVNISFVRLYKCFKGGSSRQWVRGFVCGKVWSV